MPQGNSLNLKRMKQMNAIGYFIKKTRSSRTAKFWLISYILILLLPILFSFISYYYVESSLKQKIKQTNETHLKNAQTFLDSTLGNIVTATSALSVNKNISALAQQNMPISGEQRLNMILSSNDVWRSYYVYTEYINNKYIYFADTGSIYTAAPLLPSTTSGCGHITTMTADFPRTHGKQTFCQNRHQVSSV